VRSSLFEDIWLWLIRQRQTLSVVNTTPSVDMSLFEGTGLHPPVRQHDPTQGPRAPHARDLAKTERRRFREEKEWAESQGNIPRAEQMKWNIKRYIALMESFNKESHRKVIESALACHIYGPAILTAKRQMRDSGPETCTTWTTTPLLDPEAQSTSCLHDDETVYVCLFISHLPRPLT
jgi:hypothetical protein